MLLLRSLSLESFAWIRARRTLLQATRWQQAAEQWHLALAKMTKVLCKVVFGVSLDDLRDLPGMTIGKTGATPWCHAYSPNPSDHIPSNFPGRNRGPPDFTR